MSVLLRGVRRYGEGERVDVLVDGGQIADIGPGLAIPEDADVIDATGQILLPGFVDLHTHLREPGREYAEDIETGSAAAALGGYTAVFAMANTTPVADSPVVTDHVWHRGQQVGLVDVHPVGAVTMGLAGTQLTEMGMMANGAGQAASRKRESSSAASKITPVTAGSSWRRRAASAALRIAGND